MAITIAPFAVRPNYGFTAPMIGHNTKEDDIGRQHLPTTYWGIYVDDKYVSYTSSKELAEKTKLWMEKWLKDRL
jgi:hypothetical protein